MSCRPHAFGGVLPTPGPGGRVIRLAFLFREPLAESHGVMPTHEDNRLVIPRREAEPAAHFAVLAVELFVLRVRHFARTHVEGLADRDRVHGELVKVAVLWMFVRC